MCVTTVPWTDVGNDCCGYETVSGGSKPQYMSVLFQQKCPSQISQKRINTCAWVCRHTAGSCRMISKSLPNLSPQNNKKAIIFYQQVSVHTSSHMLACTINMPQYWKLFLFYIFDDVFERNCASDSHVLAEARHTG